MKHNRWSFQWLFGAIWRRCLRLAGRDPDRDDRHDAMLRYFYYEISDLRRQVRYLAAANPGAFPAPRETKQSFDFQWRNIPDGEAMLSAAEFREQVPARICDFTGLDKSWFQGRRVLDAGCGSGRYSYGFVRLGASLTAIDQSEGGLAAAQGACAALTPAVAPVFLRRDLLEPPNLKSDFDLVWSYGVLHHTGDTYRGFRNVAPLVKPGGWLFLMLYGEPELQEKGHFETYAEYARLRRLVSNMPFPERVAAVKRERPNEDVHGWFDAISPRINDTYTFEEITGWLQDAGFVDIRRTADMINHHIIARKARR